MTDIVRHQPTAPAPRGGGALSLAHMTPAEAWGFAQTLAGSGMLPRQYQGNPASVLWALEYGRAIGLDVITTTQSVHVIQGRATASSDLMASLTRRAGHRMRITGDDQRAEVTIYRADDPEFAFTAVWDTAKAERAQLTRKDTWRQFPGAMLRARAISECVRMACPEVLHGSIYTPEELGARVDADGLPMDAEVQPLRPVRSGDTDQWATPAAQQPQTAAQGRNYLSEALDAADAAEVRQIWRDARAAGAGQDYLRQIAEVGLEKAAEAEQAPQQSEPTAEPAPAGEIDLLDGEPVDAEVVPDDAAQAAERELRAFAQDIGLPDIAADFEGAKGVPLTEATAPQIRGFLNELRGTAA